MAAQGQGANPYRVRAYYRAATTRRWLGRPVTEMLQQEGVEGLRKLPGLGERLTRTIHDLVVTGRLSRLDRLRGEMDPVLLFASVPGIGTVLVEHLHCDLGLPRSKSWRRRPTTAAWPRSPGLGRSSWQGS
jgi:DNA polymerase/3'-5' exonuclease PolX